MIDWDRVSELRDEVGAEDFDEVVELFLGEVESELVDLLEPADAAALENRLHFLKGSALNLGFSAFADLCQSGETAAKSGATDGIDLPEIDACYQRSKADFLSSLQQFAAA